MYYNNSVVRLPLQSHELPAYCGPTLTVHPISVEMTWGRHDDHRAVTGFLDRNFQHNWVATQIFHGVIGRKFLSNGESKQTHLQWHEFKASCFKWRDLRPIFFDSGYCFKREVVAWTAKLEILIFRVSTLGPILSNNLGKNL